MIAAAIFSSWQLFWAGLGQLSIELLLLAYTFVQVIVTHTTHNAKRRNEGAEYPEPISEEYRHEVNIPFDVAEQVNDPQAVVEAMENELERDLEREGFEVQPLGRSKLRKVHAPNLLKEEE